MIASLVWWFFHARSFFLLVCLKLIISGAYVGVIVSVMGSLFSLYKIKTIPSTGMVILLFRVPVVLYLSSPCIYFHCIFVYAVIGIGNVFFFSGLYVLGVCTVVGFGIMHT